MEKNMLFFFKKFHLNYKKYFGLKLYSVNIIHFMCGKKMTISGQFYLLFAILPIEKFDEIS